MKREKGLQICMLNVLRAHDIFKPWYICISKISEDLTPEPFVSKAITILLLLLFF
jgi:hypothetical protein